MLKALRSLHIKQTQTFVSDFFLKYPDPEISQNRAAQYSVKGNS